MNKLAAAWRIVDGVTKAGAALARAAVALAFAGVCAVLAWDWLTAALLN